MLVDRFYKIDQERVLPMLFDNIISDQSKRIVNQSMETLSSVAELPNLRKEVYSNLFLIRIDLYMRERLPIYKHKIIINSLTIDVSFIIKCRKFYINK